MTSLPSLIHFDHTVVEIGRWFVAADGNNRWEGWGNGQPDALPPDGAEGWRFERYHGWGFVAGDGIWIPPRVQRDNGWATINNELPISEIRRQRREHRRARVLVTLQLRQSLYSQ